MWIFSKCGFFSIVEKTEGQFQIRGRVKKDLENIVNGMNLVNRVLRSDGNDYQYRIIVNKEQMLAVMQWLGEQVDYSNFKSEIDSTPDQRDKHDAYHSIWGVMASKFGTGYGLSRSSHKPKNKSRAYVPDREKTFQLRYDEDYKRCSGCDSKILASRTECPFCLALQT